MNRKQFLQTVGTLPWLAVGWEIAQTSKVEGQQQPATTSEPGSGPERLSPTERLDVENKAERIWKGEEPIPSRYPYILPDYKIEFPHVGTEPQLFVDNYMLEWLYDLERVFEIPEKYPDPVIRPDDFEWEVYGNPLPAALYDAQEKLIKMYYCVSFGASPYNFTQVMCYAESSDGIHFTKPTDRGGLPFRNHEKTNIVLEDAFGHTVLKEPQEPDPNKRYKFVFGDSKTRFGAAYSANGYRARRTQVTAYRLTHNSGTFWDPAIRKYASYGQHSHHWNYLYRIRGGGRQESEDLLRWSPRQPVLLPDGNFPPSTEFGTMVVHKAGPLYLATVSRYDMDPVWQSRGPKGLKYNWRDYVHPNQLLAYSRDGIRWSFANNGSVWLNNGPPGSLDYGYADAFSQPILLNGKLYFYYMAARHKQSLIPDTFDRIVPKELRRADLFAGIDVKNGSAAQRRDRRCIGLATLRQDGYVRVQPVHNSGALLTRQFVFEGDRLTVNSKSEFGWVQVEVLDDEMEPIEGFHREDCDIIRGDSTAHEVRWNGNPDMRNFWNRPIRLKIHITDGWLYGFRFSWAGS